MHTPVLLKEVIEALDVQKSGKYIDATFGEGGHSDEMIRKGGNVLAIEWDEESVRKKLKDKRWNEEKGKFKLVEGNFADIERIARQNNFFPVNGILFDLGLSMEQISRSGRGFSFKNLDEPLDMRISKETDKTAAEIINSLSAGQLYEIFAKNAQEINSWAIAEAICRARRMKKIETVGELVVIVKGGKSSKKRVFQALRMEVNHELDNLKNGLEGALKIIKPQGRIAILTFHQTEDRQVKKMVKEKGIEELTRKPIRAKVPYSFEKTAILRILVC